MQVPAVDLNVVPVPEIEVQAIQMMSVMPGECEDTIGEMQHASSWKWRVQFSLFLYFLGLLVRKIFKQK